MDFVDKQRELAQEQENLNELIAKIEKFGWEIGARINWFDNRVEVWPPENYCWQRANIDSSGILNKHKFRGSLDAFKTLKELKKLLNAMNQGVLRLHPHEKETQQEYQIGEYVVLMTPTQALVWNGISQEVLSGAKIQIGGFWFDLWTALQNAEGSPPLKDCISDKTADKKV